MLFGMEIRHFVYVVTAALAVACTAATEPVGAYPPCDAEVHFKSMCCGIDRAAEARLMSFVSDGGMIDASRSRRDFWGREGERTYCLYAKSGASDAEKLDMLRKVDRLIRAKVQPNTVTTVELPHSDAVEPSYPPLGY